MTLELSKIKRSMHADVIASFWLMMQTVETLADNADDVTLKAQVEGFFKQWNRMTGDDKKPRWVSRKEEKTKMLHALKLADRAMSGSDDPTLAGRAHEAVVAVLGPTSPNFEFFNPQGEHDASTS